MSLIFKKSSAQPEFTVAAAITGTLEATQTLTCSWTVVRARDRNVTCRWYRHTADDGTDPAGVLLGTGSTYTLTGTDVGNYIRAIVTAINPAGAVSSTTSYTAIITSGDPPTPPTIAAAAVITGTADVGGTLTVTATFSGETSVTYQWYSYTTEPTGSPLAGSDEVELGTADTQPLTASEAGRWIVAVVTATNAAGPAVTSASVAMAGVDPYAPIAPTQYSVPAYDITGLTQIPCNSGDDLQAKLNNLRPGQVLVLEAGATWTGNYTVPATYLDGSDWAYIISSQMASLPAEGERVSIADAANMPKIQCGTYVDGSGNTQSLNSINNNNTLKINGGVSKLRVCGVNITTLYTQHNNIEFAQVAIGNSGTSYGEEIVLDRCLIHGTETGRNRDGIVLGFRTSNIAIINCDIDYFKGVATEAHGIHVFATPGPVLIHNNRVVACGINIFMCENADSPGTTRSPVPADITITKNLITKRNEWDPSHPSYVGVEYTSKNLIESKGSKRVLIEGNVVSNAWVLDQLGQGYFHQNEGGDGVWDVDIKNNVFYSFATAFQMANPFDFGRGYGWQRVRVQNNLFALPRTRSGTVVIGGVGSGFGRYLTFNHNTFVSVSAPSSVWFFNNGSSDGPTGAERFRVTNNIFRQGPNGEGVAGNTGFGAGTTTGRACAAVHVTDFDFNKNLSVGTSYSQYTTTYDDWRNWRSGEVGGYWSNASVGYVNTAFTELGHFALSGTSPFKNWATDGTDIGADITAIAAQINASDNPFGA